MGYKTYTCPIARRCGGCEWLAVPYPIQLRRKQEQMEGLFADMAVEDNTAIEEIVGVGGEPLSYRHKAATPFAPGPRGRLRHGFFERGSHRIVPCEHCLVEPPRAREILTEVAHVAAKLHIPAYDEDAGRGVLRHAVVRLGWKTNEALLTVVTNGRTLRHADEFATELHQRCPELVGIVQNVNTRRTNAILGRESHVLWGASAMHDELLGCRFEIGSTSFYQTNPAQTETLYQLAIEMAGLNDDARIVDAYCGAGTIGICAAAQARRQGSDVRVIGIESVSEAVACARRNARANHCDDCCRFICGDATHLIKSKPQEIGPADVVVMDPPRAGSTPEFLSGIATLGPERVVYISCNPATQVRDLTQLRSAGYRLARLVPVDMFAHTKHVETVALLERV